MRKIALMAVAMLLIACSGYSQLIGNQGYVLGYMVPTATTPTTSLIKSGSLVCVTNDTILYLVTKDIGRGSTIAAAKIAAPSSFSIINRTTFGTKTISFFVDTAHNQNVYGVKWFRDTIKTSKAFINLGGKYYGKSSAAGNASILFDGKSLMMNSNNCNIQLWDSLFKFSVNGAVRWTIGGGVTAGIMPYQTGVYDIGSASYRVRNFYGGAIDISGGLTINTNKFTVASATGNTVVAGTLGVTGTSTTGSILPRINNTYSLGGVSNVWANVYATNTFSNLVSTLLTTADVLKANPNDTAYATISVGSIVFQASDVHFYGCRYATGHKWWKLDN